MDSEAHYVTTRSGNITGLLRTQSHLSWPTRETLLSTQSLAMSHVVSGCGMRLETRGTVVAKRSTVQTQITEYRALEEC